jgi:tRNA-Thr(GGU) m(6)t(6)A37 methyltransferase TsaA
VRGQRAGHGKAGKGGRIMQQTEILFRPIGVIHSPFRRIEGMPIQPSGARGVAGTVEVFPRYAEGLRDLEGFSHIILVYHFHMAGEASLVVVPFLDSEPRGTFATRAPKRPNPIGISVVALLARSGDTLRVENVDVLDGTPLLDIKPYVPEFDVHAASRTGWLERVSASDVRRQTSDGRFR